MTSQGRQMQLAPLGRLLELGAIGALTDRELLERFAARTGEEAELAFSVLVGRHGGTVLRTCQSVLGNKEDSLDAFQATFLILARKAHGVWVGDSLAPWLNRVARHTALRAKRSAARRVSAEKEASRMARSLPGDRDRAEFWSVVHEEVERLHAHYRAPVVLCDLEGRSYEEAAQHLGCPIGTVRSRLARGRERLRSRLMHRGLGPLMLTGTPLHSPGMRDVMTPTLVDLVARLATRYTSAGIASTHPAAVLAEGVLMMMKLSRLTVAAAVFLVIVTGSATLGAWAMSVQGSHADQSGALASAAIDGPKSSADLASIRKKLEHDWASLETLEFSAEDRFLEPDKNRAYSSYRMEYFLGPGDRRTVSTTFFGPGGLPGVRDEVRSNGKTTHHLLSERGKPDVVQQVTIDDQTDRRDRYTGLMCNALWLWAPSGRPLAALSRLRGEARGRAQRQRWRASDPCGEKPARGKRRNPLRARRGPRLGRPAGRTHRRLYLRGQEVHAGRRPLVPGRGSLHGDPCPKCLDRFQGEPMARESADPRREV